MGITFAAVIDMSSVKMIIALASKWKAPAKHGDVPNSYRKADKEANWTFTFEYRKECTYQRMLRPKSVS